MARMNHLTLWLLTVAVCFVPARGVAYPEFEQYIDQTSGRYVNCSMCHTHPEGPEGVKPGQIGSLNAGQMEQLNRARAAFEPGMGTENPLLNAFGNSIIEQIGKTAFLQMRLTPEALADALDPTIDTDGDGIPDVDELRAGTLPTDHNHGDPWRLFLHNLRNSWFHVLMLGLATGAGLFGLNNLLRGFETLQAGRERSEE